MPTTIIPGNSHLRIKMVISRRLFRLHVVGQRAVSTYLIAGPDLNAFNAGEKPNSLSAGGFTNRIVHQAEILLPHTGVWYLIIMNRQDDIVAVYYEVDGDDDEG